LKALGLLANKDTSILLRRAHTEEMLAHARAEFPAECCGLIGGREGRAESVYPLRNVARDSSSRYEAAPEELFAAQRKMRAQDEELLAIYHSHPRDVDPLPSATDIQLAFYPSAIYLIIGLGGDEPVLRTFRLFEKEKTWERASFEIIPDD
jgi:[CysO sulfur-carrier protein]-S-L-cysteine hydrolase